MWKSFAVYLTCAAIYATGAIAETCATNPYPLINGTTADADQVMGNFNNLLSCADNNLAPIANPAFAGNVGIGTTAPSYALDVKTAGSFTGARLVSGNATVFRMDSTNADPATRNFSIVTNDVLFGDFGIYQSILQNGDPTNPHTNAVSRLYISPAGNVGMGTINPSTALTVVGDIRIGTSSSNGCLQNFVGSSLVGTCSSDGRLKTIINSVTNVLSGVARLDLVHFRWNEAAATIYHNSTKPLNTGFVAQSVEKAFPELVSTDSLGYKQVDYTSLQLYGLEAIKELKAENDRQAEEIAALKQAVVALQQQIQTKTAANDKTHTMTKHAGEPR